MDSIFGYKKEMRQAFVDGKRVPVSLIKIGEHVVKQIKSIDKDGYEAVQVSFGGKQVREIAGKIGEIKKGDKKKVSAVLSEGDTVSVVGISKGKGFAGVVKRWSFAGGPKTHGQSDRHRAPGSIGQGTTPGRVRKGKKMAGRKGGKQATVKNLKVLFVNEAQGLLGVSGPVPGGIGNVLKIKLEKKIQKEDSDK